MSVVPVLGCQCRCITVSEDAFVSEVQTAFIAQDGAARMAGVLVSSFVMFTRWS